MITSRTLHALHECPPWRRVKLLRHDLRLKWLKSTGRYFGTSWYVSLKVEIALVWVWKEWMVGLTAMQISPRVGARSIWIVLSLNC
jgi:hypothetical protein